MKVEKNLGVKIIKWNKYFYCIANHDSEVGYKGILFYGAVNLPVIYPKSEHVERLDTVWEMLEKEKNDNN